MDDARLPTHLWVSAKIRQCDQQMVPAYVRHKGERQGGALILKLDLFDKGCKVLTQARGLDGQLGWMSAFKEGLVSHEKAEDYITRSISRDPDAWVVEIEHAEGWHPFEGKEIAF
jgi:hypothetical protein